MTDTLVYSTETGRIKTEKPQPTRPKGDGIVRIQRQVSGRKGKEGMTGSPEGVAKYLKQHADQL